MDLEGMDQGEVFVLKCRGRVVYGEEADLLLRAGLEHDRPRMAVDLSAVEMIDARGLGVLVELENWARITGRSFELWNPSKKVRWAIEVTGLKDVLRVGEKSAAAA